MKRKVERHYYEKPNFCESYNLYKEIVLEEKRGSYKQLILALYCRDGYDRWCNYMWNNYIDTIRKLIYQSIKKGGYSKTSRTHQILGCSFEEFKSHIEKQFTEGMRWENHGQWHFDHIYPVSRAIDEKHLIELNHYTNFQPLWAKDNWSKNNRLNYESK